MPDGNQKPVGLNCRIVRPSADGSIFLLELAATQTRTWLPHDDGTPVAVQKLSGPQKKFLRAFEEVCLWTFPPKTNRNGQTS